MLIHTPNLVGLLRDINCVFLFVMLSSCNALHELPPEICDLSCLKVSDCESTCVYTLMYVP